MKSNRLLSVDFFRGITMFLLIGEFTHLFTYLVEPPFDKGLIHAIAIQFHHHPWNGLRFWDLVQPFFMFIVGVAIPLSERKRKEMGQGDATMLRHALLRSLLLLVFGWALYCIGPGRITFRFQNVLAQIAVTYLVAFLLRNLKPTLQIGISLGFLVVTELLYRFFWVEGFGEPFSPDKNFGAWFDLLISGELSGGHWVSFNAVPTIAHTMWGVLVGKLLISQYSEKKKILMMVVSGFFLVLAGYLLDPVTPIIKRISTSTFVLVSGGWSILAMALSYWVIDVKGYRNWTFPFAIVGMNPLFIYIFAHVGGSDLVYNVWKPFTMFLMSWTDECYGEILTSLATWAFLWYICYWLYKRKIFVRI